MKLDFDRNLFTQVGLDSGSLTMLGSVVHSLQHAGEYRGSVHRTGGGESVFYLSADKNSAAAHVNIDLASLPEFTDDPGQDPCCEGRQNRFVVNPRGYAVFHVSRGAGGFNVRLRRASEDQKEAVFNSEALSDGDVFSAVIIRPGTYSVVNRLGKARGEIVVGYPEVGTIAYRPPDALHVQVGPRGFDPERIEAKPGQGLVFDIKERARIVIELLTPDDGPQGHEAPSRGWAKHRLPRQAG